MGRIRGGKELQLKGDYLEKKKSVKMIQVYASPGRNLKIRIPQVVF